LNPDVLNGKTVVGTDGYILGEVDGVDVNLNTWQTDSFFVNLSAEATAELGLKKPFLRKITVSLPTKLIKAVGEVITLNEPIRDLEDIAKRGVLGGSTRVEGKKVTGAKGYVIGEVEGFDVDPTSWKVTGLEVGLTDEAATELGFERPFLSRVVVIIPSDIVRLVGNFVDLNEAIESLGSLVECIRYCQPQKQK
jgi:sporulation protein YlmC with PRC-barrel domain